MKKSLIIATISILFAGLGLQAKAAEVNEKVLKSFNAAFPKAEQVNWQEFTDNYVVNFLSVGIRERITYDKDGNFVSATRYFYEEHLPANILCKLRKKFPAQKVFGVTEVTTDTSIEYYVKLEDDKNWTTIKTDNSGTMEVVEKYKKASE
ncbi:MAG TPA: hypothetical protein VK543_07565 [Puia sp.]|jgi:hypothetical protein|nr:hypothetical protein [Puia sp.]